MEISTIVYGVIGITITVIIVATVLLPTIAGLDLDNDTYETLIGVTGTLAVIIPIMLAVRMISYKN